MAIIMDGNGRWAKSRGWARTRGHRAGVDSVRDTVTECARAGLEWLSLYALSTENYKRRPAHEVRTLMALLRRFMIRERPTFMENNVRLLTIGGVDELPARVVKEIRETERLTQDNRGMVLVLALNYGGRRELVEAAAQLARDAKDGLVDPDNLDDSAIGMRLYLPTMPDVDLLIRTAGEMRISNFLLWQVSYAEIYVTETCWPEFTTAHIEDALKDYHGRSRRFGGLLAGEER